MGTENITTRENTYTIDERWFNEFRAALIGDIAPRVDGVSTDQTHSIGSATHKWLRAFIRRGHFKLGSIKLHHSFNGAAPIGQGWMLCDGRLINEANYNTEHGAGAWATFVGISPLDGKYLPDFNDRYLMGKSATTQSGAGAINAEGNPGHQVTIAHNHRWLQYVAGAGSIGKVGNAAGAMVNVPYPYAKNGSTDCVLVAQGLSVNGVLTKDAYTENGSQTYNIKPEAIEFQVYMRVMK